MFDVEGRFSHDMVHFWVIKAIFGVMINKKIASKFLEIVQLFSSKEKTIARFSTFFG